MSGREKQQRRLEVLEAELRQVLLPILLQVSAGRGTSFFVASPERTTIEALAAEIIELAESLDTPKDGLAAAKVRAAFDEANDIGNEQRLGPIRLARRLLQDLES